MVQIHLPQPVKNGCNQPIFLFDFIIDLRVYNGVPENALALAGFLGSEANCLKSETFANSKMSLKAHLRSKVGGSKSISRNQWKMGVIKHMALIQNPKGKIKACGNWQPKWIYDKDFAIKFVLSIDFAKKNPACNKVEDNNNQAQKQLIKREKNQAPQHV